MVVPSPGLHLVLFFPSPTPVRNLRRIHTTGWGWCRPKSFRPGTDSRGRDSRGVGKGKRDEESVRCTERGSQRFRDRHRDWRILARETSSGPRVEDKGYRPRDVVTVPPWCLWGVPSGDVGPTVLTCMYPITTVLGFPSLLTSTVIDLPQVGQYSTSTVCMVCMCISVKMKGGIGRG